MRGFRTAFQGHRLSNFGQVFRQLREGEIHGNRQPVQPAERLPRPRTRCFFAHLRSSRPTRHRRFRPGAAGRHLSQPVTQDNDQRGSAGPAALRPPGLYLFAGRKNPGGRVDLPGVSAGLADGDRGGAALRTLLRPAALLQTGLRTAPQRQQKSAHQGLRVPQEVSACLQGDSGAGGRALQQVETVECAGLGGDSASPHQAKPVIINYTAISRVAGDVHQILLTGGGSARRTLPVALLPGLFPRYYPGGDKHSFRLVRTNQTHSQPHQRGLTGSLPGHAQR